jgi:bifunctional non-homologous end joining protein LigD
MAGRRKPNRSPEWLAAELELARRHQRAPQVEGWLHEVKYDGYRMLAWRQGCELQLLSRNRLDWTGKLPAIAGAILALDCRNCVLDGELVVFDENGRSRLRGNGTLAYQRACEAGLEGVMSKSVHAPYRGGRGDASRTDLRDSDRAT